ncbi:MAG: hypothetical protein Q4C47_06095, partial [Planctomycetia bacterium]|nr:hypothetical protein [Planctomycetia bacterium]
MATIRIMGLKDAFLAGLALASVVLLIRPESGQTQETENVPTVPGITTVPSTTELTSAVPEMEKLSARELCRRGMYLFQIDDPTAEVWFRESVRRDPRDPRPGFFLGVLCLRREDQAGGERWIREAAETETKYGSRLSVNVNAALEFVQGTEREFVERLRSQVRQDVVERRARIFADLYVRGDWPGVVRLRSGDLSDPVNEANLLRILKSDPAGRKLLDREMEAIIQAGCDEFNNSGDRVTEEVVGRNAWRGLSVELGGVPEGTEASAPAGADGSGSGSTEIQAKGPE